MGCAFCDMKIHDAAGGMWALDAACDKCKAHLMRVADVEAAKGEAKRARVFRKAMQHE